MSKKKSARAVQEELHMTSKPDGWCDGKRFIPLSEMSQEQLQKAKLLAQRKELIYLNRSQLFSELIEKMDEEAERRGIKLADKDTEFHKNTRQYKDRMKQNNS